MTTAGRCAAAATPASPAAPQATPAPTARRPHGGVRLGPGLRLAIGLELGLALAALPGSVGAQSAAQAIAHPAPPAEASSAHEAAEGLRIVPRATPAQPAGHRDPFAGEVVRPPAPARRPAPVVLPPPPPPPPPPLSYTYTGQIVIAGTPRVLLLDGMQVHIVGRGEQAGDYRLDAIEPGALQFTYIPTGQTLAVPVAPESLSGRPEGESLGAREGSPRSPPVGTPTPRQLPSRLNSQ